MTTPTWDGMLDANTDPSWMNNPMIFGNATPETGFEMGPATATAGATNAAYTSAGEGQGWNAPIASFVYDLGMNFG